VANLAATHFSTLSLKQHDLRKNLFRHAMCVFIFSKIFVLNVYHSKKNSARYHHKYAYIFMYSTRYCCQILMKPEYSRQSFERSSNIKFHENLSSGSRIVPCGRADGRTDGQTDRQTDRQTEKQTDRQTDITRLIVTSRNFTSRPKNDRDKSDHENIIFYGFLVKYAVR